MKSEPFDLSVALTNLTDAPIKVLAELFISDCKARNLQPRTIDFYNDRLKYLIQYFGENKVADISVAQLRLLLSKLREARGWNAQNTNHCIQAWKGLFNYLEKEEISEYNPARKLKRLVQDHTFPTPFTYEEIKRILQVMPKNTAGVRDKTCIIVLLDTGLRLAELVSMTVDSFDLGQGIIRVFGKGRKERFVPFSPATRRVLIKWLAVRSAIVRKNNYTERSLWVTSTGIPMSEDTLQFNLRKYGRAAGIEHVHAHRFRHSFATAFLVNGGSVQILQHILGHTTNFMTQRYVHITDVDSKSNHMAASPVEHWKLR